MQKAFILFIFVFSITVNAAKKDVITIDSKGKIILNKKTIKKEKLPKKFKGTLEIHLASELTVKQAEYFFGVKAKEVFFVFGDVKVKNTQFEEIVEIEEVPIDDTEPKNVKKKQQKKSLPPPGLVIDIYVLSDSYVMNGAKRNLDKTATLIKRIGSFNEGININIKISTKAKISQLQNLFQKVKGTKANYNFLILKDAVSK